MVVPQKVKIALPYDPATPLLGICPKEVKAKSQRDICIPAFVVVFAIKVETWEQLRCPSVDEWIANYGLYRQWNITQP